MSAPQQQTVSKGSLFAQQILGVDYVELYVGNPRQATHYYRTAYGFMPIAYAGLETGVRTHVSYVLEQDESHFVVTGPLGTDGPIAKFVQKHGDAVQDIALRVKDVYIAFNVAVQLGAQAVLEPTVIEDEKGRIIKATIAASGDTVHSLIQREGTCATYFPHYMPLNDQSVPWSGLHTFDHFAIALPPGELQRQADFYQSVCGFRQIHQENISTEYSSMSSIAVQDPGEQVQFVLIEPIPGKRKSQVEEFLAYHGGAGVQHVALHTQDIIRTITVLESYGVKFISAPDSYYEMLSERLGEIAEDRETLRKENILVDRDEWGYLLQIFSQPLQSRPTLFIEIIQRKNARGFGSGNIQALFKALEREQMKRNNL